MCPSTPIIVAAFGLTSKQGSLTPTTWPTILSRATYWDMQIANGIYPVRARSDYYAGNHGVLWHAGCHLSAEHSDLPLPSIEPELETATLPSFLSQVASSSATYLITDQVDDDNVPPCYKDFPHSVSMAH
jgi:hypothetical protein